MFELYLESNETQVSSIAIRAVKIRNAVMLLRLHFRCPNSSSYLALDSAKVENACSQTSTPF